MATWLEGDTVTEARPSRESGEELNLADIQGNVLRGYGFAHARHFALEVTNKSTARAFIRKLLPAAGQNMLEISTEEEWTPKSPPAYRLNLAFTWAGLGALGVPAEVLAAFPPAFREGPAVRAVTPDPDFPEGVGLGDTGKSAPAEWILGAPGKPPVHILVSLYTRDAETASLEELSKLLGEMFDTAKLTTILVCDADALPGRRVHFGYRDGIAQPRIKGAPGRNRADMQPDCLPGDFLLGRDYTNIYGGNYLGSLPSKLGDNATYAAFRILAQDVAAFERLLTKWAKRYRISRDLDEVQARELVAAKLMGRWRNGAPLTLDPGPQPPAAAPDDWRLNDFDYAPAGDHTTFFDDVDGRRCPIGSHIRRSNPRSALVTGRPHSRRLIRRSMPYGPEYVPAPDGGSGKEPERGLIGMFLCGDLEGQYEFILRVWANMDLATHGIRGTRDPIIGDQPKGKGEFVLRTEDARDTVVMTGLPQLVVTRGSAYCFMPGIAGLEYLAGLPQTAAPEP